MGQVKNSMPLSTAEEVWKPRCHPSLLLGGPHSVLSKEGQQWTGC